MVNWTGGYTIKKLLDIANDHNLINRKSNPNVKSILVPHAGYKYSGLCAIIAYTYIPKSVKKIILLCTNHKNNNITSNIDQLNKEHSYFLNKMIINYMFPLVKIEAYLVGKFDQNFTNNLLNQNAFIVATSDLTHYGKSYDFTFNKNNKLQQIQVMRNETPIILALKNGNQIVNFPKNINACGHAVIKTLAYINNNKKYKGEVVCYYNSVNVDYNNFLNTLGITYDSKHFVSYLSMIFGSSSFDNKIKRFDELMLLSSAKNVISMKVKYNIDPINFILPKWSPWWNKKNGVFVGISNNNKTRASIGYYETTNRDVPQNTIYTAEGCVGDAKRRWGGKITIQELGKLKYYINMLDEKKDWRSYQYQNFIKRKPMIKCKDGIHLTLKNRLSATYLPSVWCDYPQWSLQKLLKELAEKAGGNNLIGSKILLYKTYLIE